MQFVHTIIITLVYIQTIFDLSVLRMAGYFDNICGSKAYLKNIYEGEMAISIQSATLWTPPSFISYFQKFHRTRWYWFKGLVLHAGIGWLLAYGFYTWPDYMYINGLQLEYAIWKIVKEGQ